MQAQTPTAPADHRTSTTRAKFITPNGVVMVATVAVMTALVEQNGWQYQVELVDFVA